MLTLRYEKRRNIIHTHTPGKFVDNNNMRGVRSVQIWNNFTRDLDRLQYGSDTGRMKFSSAKCTVMKMEQSGMRSDYEEHLTGNKVHDSTRERDLKG